MRPRRLVVIDVDDPQDAAEAIASRMGGRAPAVVFLTEAKDSLLNVGDQP